MAKPLWYLENPIHKDILSKFIALTASTMPKWIIIGIIIYSKTLFILFKVSNSDIDVSLDKTLLSNANFFFPLSLESQNSILWVIPSNLKVQICNILELILKKVIYDLYFTYEAKVLPTSDFW